MPNIKQICEREQKQTYAHYAGKGML